MWYVVDVLTPMISTDGFTVYNLHGEKLFGIEEMKTSSFPHPSALYISLTANDENLIVPTPNDSIMFNNNTITEIAQPGINTHMYRSNLIFVDEYH